MCRRCRGNRCRRAERVRALSVSFETVHEALLDLLPDPPARVLDVGAGTGRDAAALAGRGFAVDAVEPVAERPHLRSGVAWRTASLPEIPGVRGTVQRPSALRGVDGPAASGAVSRDAVPGRAGSC
ncbi:methyltransferase domain-containing protein [Streptomyces sp. SID13726]|uniref:class I SAM-dependent methyltransferase n=1 Tax=Streptomyces sp. SID13726 TaxID=2706058 RepID=UPI0013BDB545|nr:methyltransferase domain-containing protein [Streptomyces sp. SID13726]NEB06003.1 class I SAM-dependent methyltransferase [Streptomyces sp. SID13726]